MKQQEHGNPCHHLTETYMHSKPIISDRFPSVSSMEYFQSIGDSDYTEITCIHQQYIAFSALTQLTENPNGIVKNLLQQHPQVL